MNIFKSFDEILRAFLDAKDKQEEKQHENDWWYASELGLCRRKHFFRRLNLQPTEEKEFRLRFTAEDGTALHNWREIAAGHMGVLVAKEERLVIPELRYKGKLDLIIILDGKKVLIDIKTERPEAFFRRAKQNEEEKKVKKFHKIQLASYYYFAKKTKYPDLSEARIYYVDRGGGCREEYVVPITDELINEMLNELKILNKHWQEQSIPEIREEDLWQCKRCSWRTICEKVEKDKLNINQLKLFYGKNKQ